MEATPRATLLLLGAAGVILDAVSTIHRFHCTAGYKTLTVK
jgi:hypothetical protein